MDINKRIIEIYDEIDAENKKQADALGIDVSTYRVYKRLAQEQQLAYDRWQYKTADRIGKVMSDVLRRGRK